MNLNSLRNKVLQRLRMQGINWGGAPSVPAGALVTLPWLDQEINKAYGRALAVVKDYPVATLDVYFNTTANAPSIPLVPLPSYGAPGSSVQNNPAAMNVYEMTYIVSGGQERRIPFVSPDRFRDWTGQYQQRLGAFAAWPDILTQRFGKSIIDMFPGTATTGDTWRATICPDPITTYEVASYGNTLALPTCAQGGLISLGTDVPILPTEFHQMIVEGAVVAMAPDLQKDEIGMQAQAAWDRYVQEAIDLGSAHAEGDAEQQVGDYYGGALGDDFGPY